MDRALVECVPNFSEGRRENVVKAILDAMRIEGTSILDWEMDPDHNRSVITLAGDPTAIQEAAIRGVGRASELIDLNQHRGVHPRMGAADVVPFIPLQNSTLDDCVSIARHVGTEIWKRFRIPVYLYEAAATRPDRTNLENVRRGQFEAIRSEIISVPERQPDFGDSCVHPSAGVTAVGARKFLIAFNVFLNTPNIAIAKKVAKAVRFSSGGLPCVKALGMLVKGTAQVSMNLTDFEMTPLHRVFGAVRQEAARLGAAPLSSELIGLIPARALEGTSASELLLNDFDPSMILENRLADAMSGRTFPARAAVEE